jgi:hypothetical protein
MTIQNNHAVCAMTSPSINHVRGDATGLSIPAHGEALRADGEVFLTDAFRAFGSLAPDNRVVQITRFESCAGGSTGDKLFLTVQYARADPGLHTELFVKFSRDFTDPRRDHGRYEMEPEARFAAIARLPGFPISVPVPYFADYHHDSGTGMIITQRIAFGAGGIEPLRIKCLDHYIDEPLPYYRAIVTALARLSGAHKSGQLAPDIDTRFPYDPTTASSDPIRYNEDKLRVVLEKGAEFAMRYPQLLPAEVRSPEFIAKMMREAFRIREHETTIQRYLRGNHDLIALCHWNAHIDNAWFRRDASGELHCGLIDWGRVNQITMGSALWGCLSAAHHNIWAQHLDELLALFVREYHEHGGPLITVDELELHLMLHVAAMGVARIVAMPEVVLFRLPEAANASGPLDPIFLRSDPARNCLHIYTVFLNLWQKRDFGAKLDTLLQRVNQ